MPFGSSPTQSVVVTTTFNAEGSPLTITRDPSDGPLQPLVTRHGYDLAERLVEADTKFVIPPTVRFEGQPGEQATMFFLDPAGNALEFKAMANPANLFAKG